MTGDTRVFLFVYHLELDGSSLWEQLLGLSYPLVAGLDQSRVDVNVGDEQSCVDIING